MREKDDDSVRDHSSSKNHLVILVGASPNDLLLFQDYQMGEPVMVDENYDVKIGDYSSGVKPVRNAFSNTLN